MHPWWACSVHADRHCCCLPHSHTIARGSSAVSAAAAAVGAHLSHRAIPEEGEDSSMAAAAGTPGGETVASAHTDHDEDWGSGVDILLDPPADEEDVSPQ